MSSYISIASGIVSKISPSKKPDWAWCYCFFPALVVYFALLMSHINTKPTTGYIEILDSDMHKIISPSANIEIIATGMNWTEGPLWIDDETLSSSYLLFSDTITNRVWKWEEGKGFFTIGKTLYMEHSGCKLDNPWCTNIKEPGSNGLISLLGSKTDDIILCEHGERSVSLVYANGSRVVLASHYEKKRLNSPNDVVWSPEQNLYFTDPPFGLYDKSGKIIQDQQQNRNGVYMIPRQQVHYALQSGGTSADLVLLDDTMTRPNGIAFSPDFSKLFVSNCDHTAAYWKVFDVKSDGTLGDGKVFFDATELRAVDPLQNNPDGFKLDINGNVFATGPGGVLVMSSGGKLLGRLHLDRKASNVAFGSDGYLYITATDAVMRVKVQTRPAKAYMLR